MFEAAIYRKRRAALVAGLARRGAGEGLALFLGNGESPMNYADNTYPFRQDSSFLYFFGPSRPGLAGTIDLATGRSAIFADDASMDDIVWTGPQVSAAELAALAGADEALPRGALAARARAAGPAGLLYLPPYREETRRELAELLGTTAAEADAGASLPLVQAALELRELKGPEEVAELEAAVATTVRMHRAALDLARPGMRESEVAATVTGIALAANGALSFPVIATTRGATLHNHDHGRVLEEGGLFLLDCGAETAGGYAGDLTTTFPIGKRFDQRQRAVYEIVLSMGRAATALLRPGLPFKEAHAAAARAAVEGLSALGLMRGDPAEAAEKGAHALFFPHGLGHQIGLDVHDMESYGEDWVGYDGAGRRKDFGWKSLRLGKPLKAGMVHSVEPGLYFIPELFARWKAEGKFPEHIDYLAVEAWLGLGGVRNEEDWLVTESGARRLGPDFDKSVAAIESARA